MAIFIRPTKKNRGFTFIELLIVIVIMGILAATIAFSIREMINRGKRARAQGDLSLIGKAVRQLELDTSRNPGGNGLTPCLDPGTLFGLTSSNPDNVGLLSSDAAQFPNWRGPYIEEIPLDPWGSEYYFRYDYPCTPNIKGCEKYSSATTVRAIFSSGPDKSPVSSVTPSELADDVVLPLCN